MSDLEAFFSQPVNLLGPAIVAGVVSATIGFLFRLGETRHRLEAEYRYEQRKKLRDVVAKYQGRLLSTGNSLNYRMWNLYSNQHEVWLNINGKPTRDRYYYLSFAYRFLNFCALLREFEREAIVIDSRIGKKIDLKISNIISALRWCLTDVELYKGLEYDHSSDRDHFYSDELRQICDVHLGDDGMPDFETFCSTALDRHEPASILRFFDGLSKSENQLRWDRLVAFHLLLLGLLNIIGHPVHKTGQRKINRVAAEIKNRQVLLNFLKWQRRHEVPVLHELRLRLAGFCSKTPNDAS